MAMHIFIALLNIFSTNQVGLTLVGVFQTDDLYILWQSKSTLSQIQIRKPVLTLTLSVTFILTTHTRVAAAWDSSFDFEWLLEE